MKRSIKVCHSRAEGFPAEEHVYHGELELGQAVALAARPLLPPGQFIRVELFSTSKTMFSDDVFNAVDAYSVYKDGKVFFSASPVPWESDALVSWEEFRRELVKHISRAFCHGMEHAEGQSERYVFYTKYGLLNPVAPGECRKEVQRVSRELELIRKMEGQHARVPGEVCRAHVCEAQQVLLSYRGAHELEVRFILEVVDMFPLPVVKQMAGRITRARRHQAVLLYHRLYLKALETKKYRTAFLYSVSASRLLKQGANLGFEESLKMDALSCVKEDNWRAVLGGVMSRVESMDSLRLGRNPYRLCKPDMDEFSVECVRVGGTGISKCCGDGVLFNGEDTKVYFASRLELRIVFGRIGSATLHGVCGSIAGTSRKVFMPIYKVLEETSAAVCVFFDPSWHGLAGGEAAEEVEMKLDELVFSGRMSVPIDLDVTWIRRKSTVHVARADHTDTAVSFLLILSNQDGFESRILGPGSVERRGREVTVLLETCQRPSRTCTLHHEISENVFETLDLWY